MTLSPHASPLRPLSNPLPDPASVLAEDQIAFSLRLAAALHRYGAPAHRLEQIMQRLAEHVGVPGQFFAVPTAFLAAYGFSTAQRTFLVRIDPGEVDLSKLAALDQLADAVAKEHLHPAEGVRRIDAIVQAPARYGPWLYTLCYGLASGAAGRFLGGGYREIVVATGIGLVIGALSLAVTRSTSATRVFEPVAAVLASVLAAVASWWMGPLSTTITVLSGLIVLVPGLTVTIAINELATRHLVSGTGRLMGALILFLFMGLGVALGARLAALFPGAAGAEAVALPLWTEATALGVGLLCFSVLFRAPGRDLGWILLAGGLVYAAARLGAFSLGPDLGIGLSAFLAGVLSNVYARVCKRPASIPLIPSIMWLVPGSIGFRSLLSLMDKNIISGVETAFQMGMAAATLVTGLLMANVIVPPRRSL